MIRRTVRRIAVTAGAALALTAAVQAAPASADPNFGAGNLPPMEITEGGSLDYSVSLPPCPDGYTCQLATYLSSGTALGGSDFVQPRSALSKWYYHGRQDGPMIQVQPIQTLDDRQAEAAEALRINARVDQFRSDCPNPERSPTCWPPESSWRWSGIVIIKDNDRRIGERRISTRTSVSHRRAVTDVSHLKTTVRLPAQP